MWLIRNQTIDADIQIDNFRQNPYINISCENISLNQEGISYLKLHYIVITCSIENVPTSLVSHAQAFDS